MCFHQKTSNVTSPLFNTHFRDFLNFLFNFGFFHIYLYRTFDENVFLNIFLSKATKSSLHLRTRHSVSFPLSHTLTRLYLSFHFSLFVPPLYLFIIFFYILSKCLLASFSHFNQTTYLSLLLFLFVPPLFLSIPPLYLLLFSLLFHI